MVIIRLLLSKKGATIAKQRNKDVILAHSIDRRKDSVTDRNDIQSKQQLIQQRTAWLNDYKAYLLDEGIEVINIDLSFEKPSKRINELNADLIVAVKTDRWGIVKHYSHDLFQNPPYTLLGVHVNQTSKKINWRNERPFIKKTDVQIPCNKNLDIRFL
ncbi:universal stress protein [Geomicrobium sp. JCM 19055]|uniref:universal stress protein n=1 Tax=Geomicrobium sp. JCM 19055 TaxID=1460649 RepID=UPI0022359A3D|nr:universal stress protein [Geomicrobium sp. JCM 19055]